jgi:hypothetical protein
VRLYFFLGADFLGGTLTPALRASDSPMAMACLRLHTLLPERPLRSPSLGPTLARLLEVEWNEAQPVWNAVTQVHQALPVP